MFRIKICGITCVSDALQAAQSGADAIGLNFYPESPRCVSNAMAREISACLPDGIEKVGVFVNEPVPSLQETAESVGLDVIQLHGDEPPGMLAQLAPRAVIRAFRCRDTGLGPVVAYLEQCQRSRRLPRAVLLDAYSPEKYGGTGHCLDWPSVRNAGAQIGGLPVVLAGGLTPENVGQAIAAARPAAVDTAGGVESAPGVKDPELMSQFVTAANAAFQLAGR